MCPLGLPGALAFCAARARARDPPYVLPTGRAAPSHCVRMSAGYPLPLVPRRVVPCIGIHARRLVAASPPAPDGAGAWTAPPPPAAPQVRRTLVVCRVRVRVRGAVPRSASALRIESGPLTTHSISPPWRIRRSQGAERGGRGATQRPRGGGAAWGARSVALALLLACVSAAACAMSEGDTYAGEVRGRAGADHAQPSPFGVFWAHYCHLPPECMCV